MGAMDLSLPGVVFQPTTRHPVPVWMVIAAAALVVCSGLGFWPWPSATVLDGVINAAFALRLALEAWTYWWARRRHDMPVRMRQVFGLFAIVGAISVLVSTSGLIATFGPTLLPHMVPESWVVLSVALWVGGLFWYPRRRSTHGGALLVTDILITLAGYGTVMMLMVTLPSLAAAPRSLAYTVLPGAVTQVLLLIGLNVLILRGVAFPSRRAFWCLVAGLASYLPNQVIGQFEYAYVIGYGWSAMVYFLGVIPEMAAAYFVRYDAPTGESRHTSPPWYAELNPLPLTAPLVLGMFLVLAWTRGPAANVLPMSIALVVVCVLLVARTVLTGRDTLRLAAEEAMSDVRVEQQTLDAVGRLAGGIAHEFNNAMTVVLGSAELGSREAEDPTAARDSFAQIHEAGTRVATITARLQASTGRQMVFRRAVDLHDTIRNAIRDLRDSLPAPVRLETDGLADVGVVPVDTASITMLLDELVANAAAAMPHGGTIRLGLGRRSITAPLTTIVSTIPSGEYVVLTVSDTGPGIDTSAIQQLFEPFFSTKAFNAGSGLGLGVVRGVVLAHHGGIVIDSVPRHGTTIAILLPTTLADAH